MQIKGPHKKKRQGLLKEVVGTKDTSTHHELIEALKERGVDATQSSISRDINELGITKRGGYYRLSSSVEEGVVIPPLTSIDTAGKNLVVLKTLPSMAPSLASIIDYHNIAGVIGTVAGDDTVFVAISPVVTQKAIVKRLKGILKSGLSGKKEKTR